MFINVQSHLDINSSILRTDLTRLLTSAVMLVIFLLLSPMNHADGMFDYQMKLAKMGNAAAEFTVGEMYESGTSVKKNRREARKWIKKAAAHGHETAKFKLWYWSIERNGLKGGNKGRLDELRLMADDENPQAMYYVGLMYANGVGLKKNYNKSLDWLNKAALADVSQAEEQVVLVRAKKQGKAKTIVEVKKKSVVKQKVKVIEKKKTKVFVKKESSKVTQPPVSAKEKVEALARALAEAEAEALAEERLKAKKKKPALTVKEAAAAAANAKIEAQAQEDGEMEAYD